MSKFKIGDRFFSIKIPSVEGQCCFLAEDPEDRTGFSVDWKDGSTYGYVTEKTLNDFVKNGFLIKVKDDKHLFELILKYT